MKKLITTWRDDGKQSIKFFGGMLFAALLFFAGISIQAAPYAYSVPFVAKEHQDIVFRDLSYFSTIRVLTISGEEVVKLEPGGNNVFHWDVKNSSGKTLATGVYYYLIDANGEKTVGKLVIIR